MAKARQNLSKRIKQATKAGKADEAKRLDERKPKKK